ncbi:MAG: hypothetical protein DYH13_11105 [Alphaproteobacteria bacterium PRO2]|nr:hypothetical protein [Alphaproteobacteria bacterium PRO2]
MFILCFYNFLIKPVKQRFIINHEHSSRDSTGKLLHRAIGGIVCNNCTTQLYIGKKILEAAPIPSFYVLGRHTMAAFLYSLDYTFQIDANIAAKNIMHLNF